MPSSCSHRVQRALDAADDGAHRDAALGVRLRVEEDLRVAHTLRVRRAARYAVVRS